MKGELKGKLSKMREKPSKEVNVVVINYVYKYNRQERNQLKLF